MSTLVALGSNLGDRLAHLQGAVDALQTLGTIRAVSRVYDTEPMYVLDQPAYLNAVVALKTELDPESLIDELHGIERAFGRRRDQSKGPRTLDLDLIAMDEQIVNSERLQVPHPALSERAFVVFPLRDVSPNWRHPLSGATIDELALQLVEPPAFAATLKRPQAP